MLTLQFYKPWKLLPDEDRKIQLQISQAKETIDKESRQFEEIRSAKMKEPQDLDRNLSPEQVDKNMTGEDTAEPTLSKSETKPSDTLQPKPRNETPENLQAEISNEGGEVIVEEVEDTVIY